MPRCGVDGYGRALSLALVFVFVFVFVFAPAPALVPLEELSFDRKGFSANDTQAKVTSGGVLCMFDSQHNRAGPE